VSFISHATFNVMRRVVIIAFTAWWFQTPLSALNAGGVAVAAAGFALFLGLKTASGVGGPSALSLAFGLAFGQEGGWGGLPLHLDRSALKAER
jgi:hypothetical protein